MSAPAPSTAPTAVSTDTAAAAVGSKRYLPNSDERRVQPRLDQDDPSATIVPSPTLRSGNAAAAAEPSHPPPAAYLYRRALECILAFSDLKTLAAALSVSKEWLAAVGSMGRVGFKVSWKSFSELVASRAPSPIARHVAELVIISPMLGQLSVDAMDIIARHMPHNLQWQQISLPHSLSDDDAVLLPQLPSLTELDFDAEKLTNFDFLRGLPNLMSLRCSSYGVDGDGVGLADRLVAALQYCTSLAELTLYFCNGMTSTHLAELLSTLSRLQSLTLHSLDIDSLSFLTQPPLTGQLSSLTLSSCKNLPLPELRHVHSLRGLRELDISDSFDARLDSHSRDLLEPPSLLLPQLEKFKYVFWR